ncbi:hypothetical protein Rhal01_01518 [Rubritalea halochordaticola]|uniref:PhoD-like phosphatase metallophosphatase domain-containing protein n=1 Tax=Rubritalea halochordaticola TaxID=714537 RepID=A0ABP9UYL9_9BACT
MKRTLILFSTLVAGLQADEYKSVLPENVDRPWASADMWTNPMEDWRLKDGRVFNTHSGGDRSVALLGVEVKAGKDFNASVKVSQVSDKIEGFGVVGLQLGRRGNFNDYRDTAVYGKGFDIGVTADGSLFIGKKFTETKKVNGALKDATLAIDAKADGEFYQLTLAVKDAAGETLTSASRRVHGSWLEGGAALIAHGEKLLERPAEQAAPKAIAKNSQKRGGEFRFAFSDVQISGDSVKVHKDRTFGPVMWTQQTLTEEGNLRLVALMAPVGNGPRKVELHVDGKKVAEDEIDSKSRTVRFDTKVDTTKDHQYQVVYQQANGEEARYDGHVRKIPLKGTVKLAALSCNDSTGFPHNLLVDNVTAQKPDAITFLGDQIYEPIGGYGLVGARGDDRAVLSYLRKYYMHGWSWGGLLKDIPSVTIPDDHDVFHGNIWGDGARLADIKKYGFYGCQDFGGYKMDAEFVNAVHRTQTGNLPNGPKVKPNESGITDYFTSFVYAGIDFAVIADRQYKSPPRVLLPEAEIRNGWPQSDTWNPKTDGMNVENARLLGEKQMTFLKGWSETRPENAQFRAVLSASPWTCTSTLPPDIKDDAKVIFGGAPKPGEYPEGEVPRGDYDSNGWPQNRRNDALRLMAKAGAIHVNGDQHLGTTGQYGIDEFRDGPFWISTPATANLWPRRWFPNDKGGNWKEGMPRYTGDYIDGFGNKITMHAVNNMVDTEREPARLYDRAPGYAVISFDRDKDQVSLEAWHYWAGPQQAAPDNKPCPDWPVIIDNKTNKRVN